MNAGTYVLEPEALARVPSDRPVSIEREVFPALIGSGAPVHGFVSDAYWIDLGTPEKYLRATFDALEGNVRGLDYVSPYVAEGAHVDVRAQLGRWVVIGPAATVADAAEVEDSVVLTGAVVATGARVRDSILGPGSVVDPGAVVEGAVLAERARVPEGARAEGARVSAGRILEA